MDINNQIFDDGKLRPACEHSSIQTVQAVSHEHRLSVNGSAAPRKFHTARPPAGKRSILTILNTGHRVQHSGVL